jgi:hypothetical protein
MTSSIQQTKTDVVIIVDNKVYQADIATFEIESGGSLPILPDKADYRLYVPNQKHAIVGDHGAFTTSGDMPWTLGDNILKNIDTFIEAQTNANMLSQLQGQADNENTARDMEIAAKEIRDKIISDNLAKAEAYYKTKDGLKDYSANERWKKQTSGMASNTFGKISTDDKSYSMLMSISVAVQIGIVKLPVNYKGVDEWITLDTQDKLTQLGKDVANFIQKCFDTELSIAADIEDGKITTTDAIDGVYKTF